MNEQIILKAEMMDLRSGKLRILNNISLELERGESLAICGSSGSGKTSLGRVLAGQVAPSSGDFTVAPDLQRVMVDQQDHFMALSGRRSTYYGQRYENQGMESTPTVLEYLEKIAEKAASKLASGEVERVMARMRISQLAGRKLLQLSNGERKRTQMAAALLQKPDLMVLDQPFVGLDVASREQLNGLIAEQMKAGISFVVICSPELIPPGVSQVLELHAGEQLQLTAVDTFQSKLKHEEAAPAELSPKLLERLSANSEPVEDVVRMRKVDVTIGEKQILKNIDWNVKSGEQWALLGHNGAGKTTLLSLVTADNPQGYTNDLVLFDRKRGSGESIWDIKNRIGYVSPELHLYFLRGEGIFNTIPGMGSKAHQRYDSLSCMDVVISGFRNEIGFASEPTDLQRDRAEAWFDALGLTALKGGLFIHASLGEQRSLLLARALVKSPDLLILDEPCQGLDPEQTRRFVQLLDQICRHLQTTLVYVTHLRNEIPSCVSKLIELEGGQIKYCGAFSN